MQKLITVKVLICVCLNFHFLHDYSFIEKINMETSIFVTLPSLGNMQDMKMFRQQLESVIFLVLQLQSSRINCNNFSVNVWTQ